MILHIRNLKKNTFCFAMTILSRHVGFIRNSSSQIGNKYVESFNKNADMAGRWKKYWYLAMKRKADIEGSPSPSFRSNFLNWNFESELSAFKLRLQIDVNDEDLSAVFNPNDQELKHKTMFENGSQLTLSFLQHYINQAYSKLPSSGKMALCSYLFDERRLAAIAHGLGFQDFIHCEPYPPTETVLASVLLACIDSIGKGEGGAVAAGKFVFDFIIPELVGKDILHDIWKPEDPMSLLVAEVKTQGKPALEARLVRQSGIDTVLPIFHVSLYSGKVLLAESAGESIVLAETDAAKNALKKIYDVENTSEVRPFGGISVDNLFLEKLFVPLKDC